VWLLLLDLFLLLSEAFTGCPGLQLLHMAGHCCYSWHRYRLVHGRLLVGGVEDASRSTAKQSPPRSPVYLVAALRMCASCGPSCCCRPRQAGTYCCCWC
jgi:hypothetical protein